MKTKIINYLQIFVGISIISAVIFAVISYITYSNFTGYPVVTEVIATDVAFFCIVALREWPLLTPSANENPSSVRVFYTLCGAAAALIAILWLFADNSFDRNLLIIGMSIVAVVASIVAIHFGIIVIVVAMLIFFYSDMLNSHGLLIAFEYLSGLILIGRFIRFIFFTKWSKYFADAASPEDSLQRGDSM